MRRGLLLCALSCACSGSPGGNGPDAGFSGPQCTPGNPFDISGTAAVKATLNVHINAMGLVDTDATAQLLLLFDARQTGSDVAVTARPCGIQLPDVPVAGQDKPVHFELSPALIASVRPVSAAARLDGTTTCATLTSDPITLLVGARMSPPTAGHLPSADANGNFSSCLPVAADCYTAITVSCACDQELDGKPGATLTVQNVPAVPLDQVYVDLRTTFKLSGQVWSSDLIVGEVDAALEQGILGCRKQGGAGCSNGEVTLVSNLNPKITQGADPSTFRGVRVPSTMTCAELVAMQDVLFPR